MAIIFALSLLYKCLAKLLPTLPKPWTIISLSFNSFFKPASLTISSCLNISLTTSSMPLPVASVLPAIPPRCKGFPVTQPL